MFHSFTEKVVYLAKRVETYRNFGQTLTLRTEDTPKQNAGQQLRDTKGRTREKSAR